MGLLIYDRRSHILYRCDDVTAFWEIDLVTETTITGRHSPITSNRTYTAQIAELIASAEKEQMVTVADLKIPAKDWAYICDRNGASLPAGPAGAPGCAPRGRAPAAPPPRAARGPGAGPRERASRGRSAPRPGRPA